MTTLYMSKVVVFDLDDTLYKEIDFLRSGYHALADDIGSRFSLDVSEIEANLHRWRNKGFNPFAMLIYHYSLPVSLDDCLTIYRFHKPDISLSADVLITLEALKKKGHVLGIITDGRSVTQRNKVEALGLTKYMDPDDIIISEETGHPKPSFVPYQHFVDKYPNAKSYTYVGDNPTKDFVALEKMGWTTVCVKDNGQNIHSQDTLLDDNYLAQYLISSPG